MRLVQAGIYGKYYDDALRYSGTTKGDSDGFRELKVTDCLGHAAILCGGVMISTAVFFCELSVSRIRMRKKSSFYAKSSKRIEAFHLTNHQYRPELALRQPKHLNFWRDAAGYRYNLT